MVNRTLKIKYNICMDCNSSNDTISNGYIVCTSCGLIKDKFYVDQLPSYSKDGMNKTMQNSIGKNFQFIGSLGSQIGYSSGYLSGYNGKKLSAKIIYKYQGLIKLHHNKSKIAGNATHLRTMIAFTRIVNTLNINQDIKSRTLYLYWKIVNKKNKLTNHVLLIALCLLKSIREAKNIAPIRFSEVIEAFSKNGHRVTNKNILRLARELNISFGNLRRKPEDYIQRIAFQVKSHPKIINKLATRNLRSDQYEMLLIIIANKFLKMLNRNERGGVQPFPFAVSIIYLSDRAISKELRKKPILTQKLLAEVTNSAEFTIRDHVYRFLGDLYKKVESELIDAVSNHLNGLSLNKYV